jgi:hypothetical protein
MADKDWKRAERKVAGFFGTTRTPLSGGNSGITRSDTVHENLYVEVKSTQKKPGIVKLWDDMIGKAKKEKKLPVLVVKVKGRKGAFLIFDVGISGVTDTFGNFLREYAGATFRIDAGGDSIGETS